MQLKQLFDGLGKFLNAQGGKMLVARAERQLAQLEREATVAVTAAYNQRFPAEEIHAPMSQVVEAVLDYAEGTLSEWHGLPMRQTADGRGAQFRYTLNFRETFQKGALGSPFRPITAAANVLAGMLQHQGRTENVSVAYRLTLDVRLQASEAGYVRVECAATEAIDPNNECQEIRSGNWSAPSWMEVRCGGNPAQQLVSYLARSIKQSRPLVHEWALQDDGLRHPVVVQYRAKLAAAQLAIDNAQAALVRHRIER